MPSQSRAEGNETKYEIRPNIYIYMCESVLHIDMYINGKSKHVYIYIMYYSYNAMDYYWYIYYIYMVVSNLTMEPQEPEP